MLLPPHESANPAGLPSNAKKLQGWSPKATLPELVKGMANTDFAAARRESMVKMAGFQAYDYSE